jgi:hypothetical protein
MKKDIKRLHTFVDLALSPTKALDAGRVVKRPAQRSSIATIMIDSDPASVKSIPAEEVQRPAPIIGLLPNLVEREPANGDTIPPT